MYVEIWYWRYQISDLLEINEKYGVPQFYDRVKELIDENYILVGNTYYYRDYLNANPFLYDNRIFIILAGIFYFLVFIWGASLLLFTDSIKDNEIVLTKRKKFFLIITCYLSLNFYSAFKFLRTRISEWLLYFLGKVQLLSEKYDIF